MQTLFPPPLKASIGRRRARRQRIRAKYFRRELGRAPRIVFALKPLESAEIKKAERETTSAPNSRKSKGTCIKERERRRRRQKIEPQAKAESRKAEQAYYLMPMDAHLLTKERSLIKFGGGEFTVVGKLVRVFPERGDSEVPSYVDSSTRETWELPLAHAPLKLLCSTNLACRRKEQEERGKARENRSLRGAIRESRCEDLEALHRQTEIPERGAVILPIAIYK